MSKFDEQMEKYNAMMAKGGQRDAVDQALLVKVTKALGPSIYNKDSSTVSCSDQTEKDRVKNNFLIKKHGLADGKNLDDAVNAVCDEIGSAERNKYRAVFYYMLVKKLGLEKNY